MKIGLIGAGHVGGTLGILWAHSGHEVMLSSRHPRRLEALREKLGNKSLIGTAEAAARFGDVICLAIPLGEIENVASGIENELAGKVVLDAMNPFIERDGQVAADILRRGIAAGEASRERFPSSRIVRAFSSVPAADLKIRSGKLGPQTSVPYAGDDDTAKLIAAQLIRDAGFEPFDVGSLHESRVLDPGGVLFGEVLTSAEIAERLQRETV